MSGVASRESPTMSWTTMATLMSTVFTVSIGYGVVLPLLPYLIEKLLGAGTGPAQVSRHTGLLSGMYTLALFLFAPAWGRFSDHHGRRRVLLVGLFGFGVTTLAFALVENLTALYVERFLSGVFAAAVTPVAAAAVGDFAPTEQGRVRRLTIISMAGIAGFLLGPILGVSITRWAASLFPTLPAGSIAIALAASGLLALLVGIVVAFAVPSRVGQETSAPAAKSSVRRDAAIVPRLLALTFIVSAGVGVFEVGLALRGKQELGLTPYQIALMFTECSLVMFVMQAIVFSPRVKPAMTRWLIAPALTVLAGGLLLVPRASGFVLMLTVIGAVAASAGILSPILTYWISSKAGRAQGWELGKQTAASSLGVTLGSGVGGLLFNLADFRGAGFILMAGLTAIGVGLSLALPRRLVAADSGRNGTVSSGRVKT